MKIITYCEFPECPCATERFCMKTGELPIGPLETHPDQINPLDRDNAQRRRIGENLQRIKPHPDKDSE